MSLINKKIYKLKLKDNRYFEFGIFKDNVDLFKAFFGNKINKISNTIQEINEESDSITYLGKIIDYSFAACYNVNITSAEKRNHSYCNFCGFELYLKVKKVRKEFYIKCSDTQVFTYKNVEISAFDGHMIIDDYLIKNLPIKDNKIYTDNILYKQEDDKPYLNVFDFSFNCFIKYNNENFHNEFLKDVDPDIEGFNSRKFGYHILKHADFGNMYKSECLKCVDQELKNEFNNIEYQKNRLFNILKTL